MCACVCARVCARLAPRGEGAVSSADIVIKRARAVVSSLHSPLICQPRSDGHLRKYMQRRWIRPLSQTAPNFRLFHTRTLSHARMHGHACARSLRLALALIAHTHTDGHVRAWHPLWVARFGLPGLHVVEDLMPITSIKG